MVAQIPSIGFRVFVEQNRRSDLRLTTNQIHTIVCGPHLGMWYLLLQALGLGGHTLMAFVLVAGAQPAHEHLAVAAEELLQVLVLDADLLGQVAGGCDELVLPQGLLGLVGLQVDLAVRRHAHQAALDGLSLLPLAHVACHRRRGELRLGFGGGGAPAGASCGLAAIRFEGVFAELFHSPCQHGVPGQGRLGAESLAALGAAVDPFGVILAPVVLDAAHAIAMPTGDGDRIVGELQTHRTVELLLCPQFSTHPDAEGGRK